MCVCVNERGIIFCAVNLLWYSIPFINLFDFFSSLAQIDLPQQKMLAHTIHKYVWAFVEWNRSSNDEVPSGNIKRHFYYIWEFVLILVTHSLTRETKKMPKSRKKKRTKRSKTIWTCSERNNKKGKFQLFHICHSILRCPQRGLPARTSTHTHTQRETQTHKAPKVKCGVEKPKETIPKNKRTNGNCQAMLKANSRKFASNRNYCYCRRYASSFGLLLLLLPALSVRCTFYSCTLAFWENEPATITTTTAAAAAPEQSKKK